MYGPCCCHTPPVLSDLGNEINEENEIIPTPIVASVAPTVVAFAPLSAPDVRCEQSEKSPPPTVAPAVTVFAPLDDAIIRDMATKHSVDEIRTVLGDARAMAAESDATPLHHQLVLDWTAILRENERLADEEWQGIVSDSWPWTNAALAPAAVIAVAN